MSRRRPPAQSRAANRQAAAVAANAIEWVIFRLRRRCRWLTILSVLLAIVAACGWIAAVTGVFRG